MGWLGLEKEALRGKATAKAGCIIALINKNGPTKISQCRSQLTETDKRLPAHDRLLRSGLKFETVSLSDLSERARYHAPSFYLTGLVTSEGELACKKYIITAKSGNELIYQNYKKCFISEVKDCLGAVRDLEEHGLGQRQSRVKCRAGPGWVALLVGTASKSGSDTMASTGVDDVSEKMGTKRTRSSHHEGTGRTEKFAKFDKCLSSGRVPRISLDVDGGSDVSIVAQHQDMLHPSIAEEEKHYRQVKVLERRARSILTKLPRESVCTNSVQSALEDRMKKERGHFDCYRLEISRIWRNYLDETAEKKDIS